ncbi:putative transcription factor C2H2 family [Helianthus debilis subsp. tardiflorus]
MIPSLFVALFLPSIIMTGVLLVYICLFWYTISHLHENKGNGLSATELNKLPRTTGKELGLATECSICLDVIEEEQLARVVPGCNHGFHLQCADTWLSKNAVCPVCRNKLESDFFESTKIDPC